MTVLLSSKSHSQSILDPYPIYQQQENLVDQGLELIDDGNEKQASVLFSKALNIYKQQLVQAEIKHGSDGEELIDILARRAYTDILLKQNNDAISCFEKALTLCDKYHRYKFNRIGRNWSHVAFLYKELGELYLQNNQPQDAIKQYEKCVNDLSLPDKNSNEYAMLNNLKQEICRNLLRLYEKHGKTNNTLRTVQVFTSCGGDDALLGDIYETHKEYTAAVKCYAKKLGAIKAQQNWNSEELGKAEYDMARILYKAGDLPNARDHLLNAADFFDQAFDESAFGALRSVEEMQEQYFCYSFEPLILDPLKMAQISIRRKGVLLDTLMENKAELAGARNDPVGRQILNAYNTAHLARVNHENNCAIANKINEGKLSRECDTCDELNLKENDLEKTLLYGLLAGVNKNRKLPLPKSDLERRYALKMQNEGRKRRANSIDIGTVIDSLPFKSVFLDFIQYQEIGNDGNYNRNYGVLVLCAGQKPAFVRVDNATAIDDSIAQMRKAITQGKESLVSEQLNNLARKLWIPIYKELPPDTKTVIISPDGMLNFLSFATLVDANGHFLSENYEIVYLGSGRDLAYTVELDRNTQLSLFANPVFDKTEILSNPNRIAMRSAEIAEYNDIKLPRLPGTEIEGKSLIQEAERMGWTVAAYFGDSATEQQIRALKKAGILHLATHGFYLNTSDTGGNETRGMKVSGLDDHQPSPSNVKGVDPMRASGIALTGAQVTLKAWSEGKAPDTDNDGILTAEEVAGLDLSGTWLVTLSACETGVGEVKTGEGVFGLRRAFMMAGAKNLLMTLWPVNDATTADFMKDFYHRALASGDAPRALADTQRDWLVKLRREKGLLAAVRDAGPFIMTTMGALPSNATFSAPQKKNFLK
ncbi:MAG: CHAT domain-containing tetratricopeptide repeat protein [Terrimicrobiaceae bacterium]